MATPKATTNSPAKPSTSTPEDSSKPFKHRPISVVTSDTQALEDLLNIHAPKPVGNKILDVTFNTGKIWGNLDVIYGNWNHLTTMDINPKYKTDFVGSYRELANTGWFQPGQFDVIVFDPPHMADAKKSIHEEAYGHVNATQELINSFYAFFAGADVLLPLGGIVLAKIADQTHGQRYVWNHVHLINAAMDYGFTPCDMVIKTRKNVLNDPKWKNIYHVRKAHSYWIVFRKGLKACQRSTNSTQTAHLLSH